MALIALIAAAEAMLYSASRSKRGQTRRQQVLMGNSLDSVRALPLVASSGRRPGQADSKCSSLPK